MTRNLFSIFLFLIMLIVCNSEPLNFKINVPTDPTVAAGLIKVLQEAYNMFRSFLLEMNKRITMLGSKRVMSFRSSTLDCFNIVRSKTIDTPEELEITVKALNAALFKCVTTGICAVGELLTLDQSLLCVKLLQTLNKLELAFQITLNYFDIIQPGGPKLPEPGKKNG